MIRSCRGVVSRCIVIAAAAALVPIIAGCEAGTAAPTLEWHAPTAGTNLTIGDLIISDAFVLGAPLGSQLQPGQSAGLYFAITNTGGQGSADRLIAIAAPGTAKSVTLPGGHVAVNAQHSVLLTGPRPQMILNDLLRPVTGGSVITLQLSFLKAGVHTIRVPVMPMAQYYSTYSPAPTPTPTVSPAHVTATPSGSPARRGRRHHRPASPTPSPTPSPSPGG